jgi:hypothetical protein
MRDSSPVYTATRELAWPPDMDNKKLACGQHSIRNRRISDLKVELEFKVRRARVLMSSREQSREIRTSSQSAPPLIISFAFTSEIQV